MNPIKGAIVIPRSFCLAQAQMWILFAVAKEKAMPAPWMNPDVLGKLLAGEIKSDLRKQCFHSFPCWFLRYTCVPRNLALGFLFGFSLKIFWMSKAKNKLESNRSLHIGDSEFCGVFFLKPCSQRRNTVSSPVFAFLLVFPPARL